MGKSVYVPRQHLVMATEKTPAGFRPANQGRLESARSTNPLWANTDASAFMPGMGECRSGNGHSDLGLGGKWLKVQVSGLGGSLWQARAAMLAQANAAGLAARAAAEAATEYRDASGRVISKAEYDRQMAAPAPSAPVYQDAAGKVISKAEYEELSWAARRRQEAAANAARAAQMAKPKPIIKRLPKRGVNGLGNLPTDCFGLGEVDSGTKNVAILCALGAAFLLYKNIKKSR